MVITLDLVLQLCEVLRQQQTIFCFVTPESVSAESRLQHLCVCAVVGCVDAVLDNGVPLVRDAGECGQGHKDHKEDSAGRLQ